MGQLHVDSLYPLAAAEKGGVQAMVPFKAKMLMMAVCSWLRISTSYKHTHRLFKTWQKECLKIMFKKAWHVIRNVCLLTLHIELSSAAVCVHKSAQHVCLKHLLCPYLVHGVLGDDLECPQGSSQVHEHDRNGPQGYDCQDAHKRVDPYSSSGNTQLKHGHTHTQSLEVSKGNKKE